MSLIAYMKEGRKRKRAAPPIEPCVPKKLSMAPSDTKGIEELANKLIDWVYGNQVYNIADFPLSLRMSPRQFYKCTEKNDYFSNALSVAKYVIASRILNGWREGRIAKEYAHVQLYQYDNEYKNAYGDARLIERKAITDMVGAGGTRFIIEAPPIPESDKVKKLERKV